MSKRFFELMVQHECVRAEAGDPVAELLGGGSAVSQDMDGFVRLDESYIRCDNALSA